LYCEIDKIWVARGMSFWAVDYFGKRVSQIFSVGSFIYNIRPLRQLLRKGIHHFIPLKNGSYLVSLKKKVLILDKEGKILSIFEGFHGNKPGHRGIAMTPNGYIFFGEYALNTERNIDIVLYRSIDNGISFQPIKVFKSGEIRHIHFIEWDEYDKCIWLGTGDYGENNNECRLYRSFDYGDSFDLVGQGSQMWRSIAVCPTKNYVVWGTDAGSCKDDNYVLSYDKNTNELKKIQKLTGPCHGMCVNSKSNIYISTGVEGGENELDKFAKLYKLLGDRLFELKRVKKDIYPLILQYGVIRFPLGCHNTDKVVYTMMGLKGNGEAIYICEERDYE
jgi:hypothetical protein